MREPDRILVSSTHTANPYRPCMNPSTVLASVLLDELTRCGLADVVLAPGSRSTPFALALHDLAQERRIRLHVRVDERSAGFLAVGLAKGSGLPVPIVCTSGTAVANLYPAVIEAHESGVPLLILSADRPPELRDTGASQTIDQIKMFGSATRWNCEVGTPENLPGMIAYWRSLAGRAWARSLRPAPGPVHLNLSLREPLIPEGDPGWCEPLDSRPQSPWVTVHEARTAPSTLQVPRKKRGVLLVGDGAQDVDHYLRAAAAADWPVISEPTGNARHGSQALSSHYFLLGEPDFLARHRPEVVVSLGKPGLSRQVLALLDGADQHVVVTSDISRWPDPIRSATEVAHRVELVGEAVCDPAWMESWRAADRAATRAVDLILDAQDHITEPGLTRDLLAALPSGSLLFCAASMPIRDTDRGMRPRADVKIMANRGANGIDGLVSTAIGAALTHHGPAYALLGDLAFLHDQNGLLLGQQDPRPDLTIIVVNNRGGGIFSMLPQNAFPQAFERVFGTPQDVDVATLVAAHRLPYTLIEHAEDVADVVGWPGLRVVEVRTEREATHSLRQRLERAAHKAILAVRDGGARLSVPAP